MRARWFLLLTLFSACKCGSEKTADAPEDVRAMFERLFAKLPAAKIKDPIDAIPSELSIVASSPDPEAWRAWAETRPFVQGMMKTPLYEDLRLSRAFLALEGLRQQVARVSSFVGKKEDLGAIWRGPTAAGIDLGEGEEKDRLLLVKRIDPAVRELVRFGAAFATAAKPETGESRLSVSKVGELELYTLAGRGEAVSFVLFRDLLVAGSDATLVEHAAQLAAGESPKDVTAAPKSALGKVLPPAETPGIHLAISTEKNELAAFNDLAAVGVSLIADPAQPFLIRRTASDDPGPGSLSLLRYAGAETIAAFVDGAKISVLVRDAVGVPEAIADELTQGSALILGENMILAVKHSGKAAELEAPLRAHLAKVSGKKVERLVLEDMGGAVILKAEKNGVGVAITPDALLVALDAEKLRSAVAAGAGKAPSLADRQGIDLGGAATGGVYLDVARASNFLARYYKDTLGSGEADAVLAPSFTALAGGGAFFSKLEAKGDKAEGALRALP